MFNHSGGYRYFTGRGLCVATSSTLADLKLMGAIIFANKSYVSIGWGGSTYIIQVWFEVQFCNLDVWSLTTADHSHVPRGLGYEVKIMRLKKTLKSFFFPSVSATSNSLEARCENNNENESRDVRRGCLIWKPCSLLRQINKGMEGMFFNIIVNKAHMWMKWINEHCTDIVS